MKTAQSVVLRTNFLARTAGIWGPLCPDVWVWGYWAMSFRRRSESLCVFTWHKLKIFTHPHTHRDSGSCVFVCVLIVCNMPAYVCLLTAEGHWKVRQSCPKKKSRPQRVWLAHKLADLCLVSLYCLIVLLSVYAFSFSVLFLPRLLCPKMWTQRRCFQSDTR